MSDLAGLFARHAPGRTIPLDLATVRRGPEAIGRFLNEIDHGVIIADAETNDDLTALAHAIASSDLAVLAGTAGLARSVASVLPGARADSAVMSVSPPGKGILVVAGSRDRVTVDQVDRLREQGVPVISLAPHHLDGHDVFAEVMAPLAALLAAGESVVFTTAGLHSPMHGSEEVRERLATIVASPDIGLNLGGWCSPAATWRWASCRRWQLRNFASAAKSGQRSRGPSLISAMDRGCQ
jgi:uncharacterized protein YgbK (DUF1537 family)